MLMFFLIYFLIFFDFFTLEKESLIAAFSLWISALSSAAVLQLLTSLIKSRSLIDIFDLKDAGFFFIFFFNFLCLFSKKNQIFVELYADKKFKII